MRNKSAAARSTAISEWRSAYRLRWKRKKLCWRARLKKRELSLYSDNTDSIRAGDILLFSTIRNEMLRLPWFLDHYRRLGVAHFLIVDNGSTDGSTEYLRAQPDVSLWTAETSYRDSRFGMDWLMALQQTYGHGHWCLTIDADELLIYPHWQSRDLSDLTNWLDNHNSPVFSALMLDMYPKGPLSQPPYEPGTDPTSVLKYFDGSNYSWEKRARFREIWVRGGVRQRAFFAGAEHKSPHLHKTPLVKWQRSYAWVSSTHTLLPRALNCGFDASRNMPSGALLHCKFLPNVIEKSAEETQLKQHFTHPDQYQDYYSQLISDPDLYDDACSHELHDWQQLEALGILWSGHWGEA